MIREAVRFLLMWLIGAALLMQLPHLLPSAAVPSFSRVLFVSAILAAAFTLIRPFFLNYWGLETLRDAGQGMLAGLIALLYSILALSLLIIFFDFDPNISNVKRVAIVCAFLYVAVTWVLSSLIIRLLDKFFEW
ncbi:MAG: hypothetical protein LBE15_05545 [Burkholderiales bacterium]|jgi:uncharacterized membrane protein YvlD (DUF360 family)|nr:hypothetical protein [Burkholderiales bacterium]